MTAAELVPKLIIIIIIIFSISMLLLFIQSNTPFHLWTVSNRAAAVPPLPMQSRSPQIITSGNTVLPGQPASLLKVRGTKTLLISAYLEHRKEKEEVCVITIMLRRENVSLHCHLRCEEQLLISGGVKTILRDHFNFPYGAAVIMCPLPSGCKTPTHVAITSAVSKLEGLNTSDHQFLEIKNQKKLTDSFRYNFTVCFSTMFNFTNVLQLVQSLEMLQILGVNRVVIYKTNCSADTQRVLDYYTNKGFVEVIPWSLSSFLNPSPGFMVFKDPGDIHYFGQIPVLNDFLYRYMYQSRYVSLHDPDELILPQSVNSWVKLLPLLEKKFGADKCYMFQNNIFPREAVLPPPKPQTLPPQEQWKNVSGVNILAHLYKEPMVAKLKRMKFKIIVNPRAVFSLTVHGVLSSQRGCAWVDGNIARMYHTRSQTRTLKPDELIYDGRLLSYCTNLIPGVNKVLRESGLVPAGSMK